MAHEVETMAWTNEVPWHGLGTQVAGNLTTDEMLKASGLDWKVEKAPLSTKDDGVEVPSFYALRRDSDRKVFDVCGKEYTPIQNAEAFEFFREFVEAGKATMETAGSLKGGRMVWVLANLGKSFKLAGKDEVKSYLLLSNPHQQGKASIFKYTNIRVVCNNTLTAALRSEAQAAIRRAHRGEFNEAAREAAKQALGIAREQHEEFAEFALKLSKTKMDPLQIAQFLAEVWGEDEVAALPTLELITKEAGKGVSMALQAMNNAPGQSLPSAKGTAWGALNAVTYVTDHLLRNSNDSRVFNAWFGKSEKLKVKAQEILAKI